MPRPVPPRRAPERRQSPERDRQASTGPESPEAGGGTALQGVQGVILGVTLLAMLSVVLLPLLRPEGGRTEPLRVAIAPPSIERAVGVAARDLPPDELTRIAEAARDALERHLVGRKWLVPIEIDDALGSSAAEIARAVDADEILRLELRCAADQACRGRLVRVRAIDGSSPWRRGSVELETDDLRSIDRGLEREIQIAFLRFPRHDQAPRLFAQPDDFARYLDLRRRFRAGFPVAELLPLARHLTAESPRFAAGYRLQAELLRQIGGAEALAEASDLLARARDIAPADPRALEELIAVERALGRDAEVAATRARLEALQRERRWLSAAATLERQADPQIERR